MQLCRRHEESVQVSKAEWTNLECKYLTLLQFRKNCHCSFEVYNQLRFRGGYEQPTGLQHSPASSVASSQDSIAMKTVGAKKRSSSASGLKTLGRLFGKKDKQKHLIGGAAGAGGGAGGLYKTADFGSSGAYYSDSELSSGEASMAFAGGFGAAPAGAPDFDRRKRKKHELLEEAMKARTPFALWNGPTIVAWLEVRRFFERFWNVC